MYKLYTDKPENFKCSIDLEGASLDDTKVRLVLESGKMNLLFEGEVDQQGNCVVSIDKLKNILKEGTEGTMKLEVIAEDTFFSPWEDQFTVNTSKKVTVEVLSNNQKPLKESKVKVKVQKQPKEEAVEATPVKQVVKEHTKPSHSTIVLKLLEKKGINRNNLAENINPVSSLIFNYSKKYGVKDSNKLLSTVFEKIK